MITVVGIGADGWDALSPDARHALEAADVLAGLVTGLGYGPSPMTVPSDLGADSESVLAGTAETWSSAEADPSALNVIALESVPGPGAEPLPRVPGLPDAAFEHDGQLTKRASPVGSFTARRAAMPVTVWSVTRKDVP